MPSRLLPQPARGWPAWPVVGLVLALAANIGACGPRENPAGNASTTDMAAESLTAPAANAPAPGAGAGAAGASTAAAPAAPRVYLAEAHVYRFAPPAAGLKALWQKHLDACRRLGPGGCAVEEANVATDDDGATRTASLTIRVANAQAPAFLAALDADAPREHGINRTDKTTEVIDTDARLANAEQLRARLQALRAAAGKLSDVVDLETRIAEVQGQIEAARGTREYLRQQTEKTKIELTYGADGRALDGQTWRPVREALGSIGPTLAMTVSGLIYALTALVPIGLVLGALWWLGRAVRRRVARPKPVGPVSRLPTPPDAAPPPVS